MRLFQLGHVDINKFFARNCNVVVLVCSAEQIICSLSWEILALSYKQLVDFISAEGVLLTVSVKKPFFLQAN